MKLWKKFSVLAAVVLLMFTWRPAVAIVVNALYDFVEIGAPSSPSSGFGRIFFDATAHLLSSKNSSGTVTHTVATQDCSSGSQLVQKINADGSVTCASGGGGGGGFIQPLTAPVSGSFSNLNFNVGTGVVTTRVNQSSPVAAITLDQNDPNHTGNTVAIQKAIINAAFTVTIGISTASQPPTGAIVGLWLGDGTTNGLFWGFYNQTALIGNNITSLTNSGGGSGNQYIQAPYQPNGPLLWLRIQETASARNYYVSADGATFDLVFTESNTAHFTTANYGAGTYLFNGAGTSQLAMYSFSETTP